MLCLSVDQDRDVHRFCGSPAGGSSLYSRPQPFLEDFWRRQCRAPFRGSFRRRHLHHPGPGENQKTHGSDRADSRREQLPDFFHRAAESKGRARHRLGHRGSADHVAGRAAEPGGNRAAAR